MKSETKANIILYACIILLILIGALVATYFFKKAEFMNIIKKINSLNSEQNYVYSVKNKKDLDNSYILKMMNGKYRIYLKDEPGYIEGNDKQNDSIWVLPEKEAYTPIKKEENILKNYPEKVKVKYGLLDIFNKNVFKKANKDGEDVVIFNVKKDGKEKEFIFETKNNTLRSFVLKDDKGNILEEYVYNISLKTLEESDVEPIDRNSYTVRTSENFENLKNEILAEKQKEEDNKDNLTLNKENIEMNEEQDK